MECPACGSDYIEGEDLCRECGSDLTAPAILAAAPDAVEALLGQPIGGIGLRDPIVMEPRDSVAAAIERMRAEHWGSVMVVEDRVLRGIFTEQDLLRRVDPGANLETTLLIEVMTPEPDVYGQRAPVSQAVNGMALRGNRHLPVVDDEGRLLGNVGVRMILAHVQRVAEL